MIAVTFDIHLMFSFASERQSPSLDDLEKSLQNVSAMLQSAPPKQVSAAQFRLFNLV